MLNRQSRVIFDTLLPAGTHSSLTYGLFEVGFDAFWSDFERTVLPSMRWGVRIALFVTTWLVPLLIWRLPPLTRCNRASRERALIAMASSRFHILRQLFVILTTVACFCYGADYRVRDIIGYPAQHDDPRPKVTP